MPCLNDHKVKISFSKVTNYDKLVNYIDMYKKRDNVQKRDSGKRESLLHFEGSYCGFKNITYDQPTGH